MYCVGRFCRVCICASDSMKTLSSLDTDNISFYNKLLTCVPELKSEILNEKNLLCDKCCQELTKLYAFRNLCTKNNDIFEGYVLKLRRGIVKQGDLVINLEKIYVSNSENTKDRFESTINKTSASENIFFFDLSSVDELKPENCVRVVNTEMCVDPIVLEETQELNNSIEDLSRSDIVVLDLRNENSNETNSEEPVLENTDGEIKIERDCEFEDPFLAQLGFTNNIPTTLNVLPSTEAGENIPNNEPDIDFMEHKIKIEHESCDRRIKEEPMLESQVDDHIPISFELQSLNDIPQTVSIVITQDPNLSHNNIIVKSPIVNRNIVTLPTVSTVQNIGVNPNINPFVQNSTSNQGSVFVQKTVTQPVQFLQNTGNQTVPFQNNIVKKSISLSSGSTSVGSVQSVESKSAAQATEEKTPIPCDLCGKLYKDAKCLKKHKYVMHNTSGPVNCPHCPKVFTNNYSCQRHILTHSATRVQYKCPHCDHAPFLVATGMRRHIARCHPELSTPPPPSQPATKELEFPCDQCDRRYSKRQSLRRHKRDVHNDRIRPQKEPSIDGKNGISNVNLTMNSINNVSLKSSLDDLASIDQIQSTFNAFNNPVKVLDSEMNGLVHTLSADSMNAVFMTEIEGTAQFD